jgi:ATP-dependent DNA helicase RecG
MLGAKGLETVEDLLHYFPFRYEDRSNLKTIAQLAPGEQATVIAEVRSAKVSGFRRRNLGLFEAEFTDASRAILLGKWFHGAYLADSLTPGKRVALFGKIEFDSYRGELQMMHPETEFLTGEDDEGDSALHVGRIVPVYEAAGKVSPRVLRTLLHRVLQEMPELEDRLPESVRNSLRFPSRTEAVREAHFPAAGTPIRILNDFRSPAQFRLIFEEFFWLECGLEIKRQRARAMPGIEFALTDRVREQIKKLLPFKPTNAQKRVLKEIAEDMVRPSPMNRLLQGDVGSGKTIVAAEAALIALENGYQVAILAPTEILAAQHLFSLKPLLQKVGYVHCTREAEAERDAAQRADSGGHRDARADRERCRVREAGAGDHRRTAPVRGDAAVSAGAEGRDTGRAGDDGDADSADAGDDTLRGSGCVDDR